MGAPNLHEDAGGVFPWDDARDRASKGFSPLWPYPCLKNGVFEPIDRFDFPEPSMFDHESNRKRATGV
eukprot:775350-Alexandrium_andersonii.AAC.1